MDYQKVAGFLLKNTVPAFQKALNHATGETLIRCGFNPAEAAQLVAAIKSGGSKSVPDNWTSGSGASSIPDNWTNP